MAAIGRRFNHSHAGQNHSRGRPVEGLSGARNRTPRQRCHRPSGMEEDSSRRNGFAGGSGRQLPPAVRCGDFLSKQVLTLARLVGSAQVGKTGSCPFAWQLALIFLPLWFWREARLLQRTGPRSNTKQRSPPQLLAASRWFWKKTAYWVFWLGRS